MAESVLRLVFTTYQSGILSLIGLQEDGRLSNSERTFNRCMGSCVDGGGRYIISHYQLWRFESSPEAGAATLGSTGSMSLSTAIRRVTLIFMTPLSTGMDARSLLIHYLVVWRHLNPRCVLRRCGGRSFSQSVWRRTAAI